MRLIDADALSELVGEPIEVFLRRLDLKLPSIIEAEPVKHGEWILWDGKYDAGYICSRCKRPAGVVEAFQTYKYCPFCGAKMRKAK